MAADNTTAIDRSWYIGYEQAESEFAVSDVQWCDTHEGVHLLPEPEATCVLHPMYVRRGKRAF